MGSNMPRLSVGLQQFGLHNVASQDVLAPKLCARALSFVPTRYKIVE